MPVLEQITGQLSEASDKFFDVAETANDRAHGATKNLVSRIQDTDLPFADRLPEPIKAVDAYFGFWSKGIETNRAFAEKVMNRFTDVSTDVIEAPVAKTPAAAKKAPAAKKTTKNVTAKKA
ncbi:MAG: hypothetical protein ACI81L_003232 [Verrucomicrobiales bacterium]|jgi:hypothetical protein